MTSPSAPCGGVAYFESLNQRHMRSGAPGYQQLAENHPIPTKGQASLAWLELSDVHLRGLKENWGAQKQQRIQQWRAQRNASRLSNFAMPASPIVQLCGVRTENCPPGFKTGDQISPPGGYVGGGLQMQTDIAVDPAGNAWSMDNWQDIDSCFPGAAEAASTRCGGQGVVIFYGMAKPVRAPQIGPASRP